jgi:hypothetical protein
MYAIAIDALVYLLDVARIQGQIKNISLSTGNQLLKCPLCR